MSEPNRIPNEIIISTAHAQLQQILDKLDQAEPIMIQPSGEWPAYVIESEMLDSAREDVKRLLNDFKRINRGPGKQ